MNRENMGKENPCQRVTVVNRGKRMLSDVNNTRKGKYQLCISCITHDKTTITCSLTQSKEQILHCLLASLSSLVMPSREDSMGCHINSRRRNPVPVSCSGDARNASNL